jgi:hypothetical protein
MRYGPVRPECPIRRPKSSARISERGSEFNGGRRTNGPDSRAKTARRGLKSLDMRGGNPRTIAAAHQHAILSLAQIRHAHGEPYSDGGQRYRERDGCNVRQHAMAKIIRFIPAALIARQIIGRWPAVLGLSLGLNLKLSLPAQSRRAPLTRRMGRGARPELEHPMLFLRHNGPLGIHWHQLRDILVLFSTPATRLAGNVGMARMR